MDEYKSRYLKTNMGYYPHNKNDQDKEEIEFAMNWRKTTSTLLVCLLLAVLVCGCAQSNQEIGTVGSSGVAGFWAGLWHGLILPVAFVISLFNDSVGIYEIHNSGNWYNFGFMLGTWFVFGSILASNRGTLRDAIRTSLS